MAEPEADARERQLDQDGERHRLKALTRWSSDNVKPGIDHQHDRRRAGRGGQVPGPAQREVRRAGQRDEQHDIETRPGDVVVRRQLAGRQGRSQVPGPGQHDHREQGEHRAGPAHSSGLVGQHRVLWLSRRRDQRVQPADQVLWVRDQPHGRAWSTELAGVTESAEPTGLTGAAALAGPAGLAETTEPPGTAESAGAPGTAGSAGTAPVAPVALAWMWGASWGFGAGAAGP